MEQKITIKIAGRDHVLRQSPEIEGYIRAAASEVNGRIAKYQTLYPGKDLTSILSFVALNECIDRLAKERQVRDMQKEAEKLQADTESYLEDIGRKQPSVPLAENNMYQRTERSQIKDDRPA